MPLRAREEEQDYLANKIEMSVGGGEHRPRAKIAKDVIFSAHCLEACTRPGATERVPHPDVQLLPSSASGGQPVRATAGKSDDTSHIARENRILL